MNKEYKWERRSPEWIKENPGKPTMYKVYDTQKSEFKAIAAKNIVFDLDNKPIGSLSSPTLSLTFAAGVYVIECVPEKCVYIGQSRNVPVRLRNHKYKILIDFGSDDTYTDMRSDRIKHGIDSFTFSILHHMPEAKKQQLCSKEAEAISYYISKGYKVYNKQLYFDFLGIEKTGLNKQWIKRLVVAISNGKISDANVELIKSLVPLD